jgi:hypothetical protein
MGRVDFRIAVRAGDQHACRAQAPCEVGEEVERAFVGVVEVFEQEEQRLPGAGQAQERGDGFEQEVPRLVEPPGGWLEAARAQSGDNAGEERALRPFAMWPAVPGVRFNRFHKWEIGKLQRALLVALPGEDAHTPPGRRLGDLPAERGLPDPRLAADHDDARAAGGSAIEQAVERGPLPFSPHEYAPWLRGHRSEV